MATSVEPEALDTTPEPAAIDHPVFDADAERESDKNLRIAKALFADDEPDDAPVGAVGGMPKIETPPGVTPKAGLPSPPAQRAREAAAAATPSDLPGFTKDARGVYHRPNGTVASKDEIEAARASVPAPIAGAPAAPVEPAKVEAAPDAGVEPLRFMAYGKAVEVPGGLYKPGHGLFMPEAGLADFRRTWARGTHGYDSLEARNEQLRTQLTNTYSRKEAEADALLSTVGGIFKDEASLLAFAQSVVANPKEARREIRNTIREQELELQSQVQQPDLAALESAPETAEIHEALSDEVTAFFTDPRYGLLGKFTPTQQRRLESEVHARMASFLTVVDRDLDANGHPVVSAGQVVAVRKGESLVNRAQLLAELQYVAEHLNDPQHRRTSTASGTPAPSGAVVGAASTTGSQSGPVGTSPRPAPPSAVGRSRAQVPQAPQPETRRRGKDTIPNHSISAAAKYLFDED